MYSVTSLPSLISKHSGSRGDVEDPFLDLRTPTLFVLGQQAPLSPLADVEDLREKIKAETSLVLVGGADDQLRMCKRKKKLEGITQVSCEAEQKLFSSSIPL